MSRRRRSPRESPLVIALGVGLYVSILWLGQYFHGLPQMPPGPPGSAAHLRDVFNVALGILAVASAALYFGGRPLLRLLKARRDARRIAGWTACAREAAEKLGLRFEPWRLALGGTMNGLDVRVAAVSGDDEGERRSGTCFLVFGLAPGFSMGAGEIPTLLTGDRTFDRAVPIAADVPEEKPALRAMLDAHTRSGLLRAFEAHPGLDLRNGRLAWTSPAPITDAGEIASTVKRLVSLASALRRRSDEVDVPAKLASIAEEDPETAVRVACLRDLVALAADRAVAQRALAVAFGDASLEVRAMAAALSPDDPRVQEVLLAQAEAEGADRLAAIDELGRRGTVDAVERLRALARGVFAGEVGVHAAAAVEAIQARIAGAAHGQLSVAPPAEAGGELSAAEPERDGALSFAKATKRPVGR